MSRINARIASQNFSQSSTRTRQTVRTPSTFKRVLSAGANVLLSGARAATSAVGLPIISSPVASAGFAMAQSATQEASNAVNEQPTGSVGLPAGGNLVDGAASLAQLQSQRYGDELQLLQMQSQIQAHNRQITLASNLMKSKHDTEKAAINNMRS